MPTYKLIETETHTYIERTDADGKVWGIPIDETNTDYQAYLAFLEAQKSTKK